MTKIDFVRHERDCPANRDEPEKAQREKRKPRFIIDWNVIIDGEHRATFKSHYHRRGYDLRDILGRDIRWWKATRYTVPEKGDFIEIIENALELKTIPTVADIEAENARRAAKKAADEAAMAKAVATQQRRQRVLAATEDMTTEDWRVIVEALHHSSTTQKRWTRSRPALLTPND